MCDRMFDIMDKDKDGYVRGLIFIIPYIQITLSEYLNYVDVLLYGTEEEKLIQSFELLDMD
jgi:Ca2+-binding EF-hand superfamily protein